MLKLVLAEMSVIQHILTFCLLKVLKGSNDFEILKIFNHVCSRNRFWSECDFDLKKVFGPNCRFSELNNSQGETEKTVS